MRMELTKKQAFLELAKGERTAAALEKQLSAMEAKIEALLAQAKQDQRDVDEIKAGGSANGEAAEAGKTDDQR